MTGEPGAVSWRELLRPSPAVALVAALKLLLHLGTNWRYGFHRDELYYVVGGLHLDWGYVDHPPLVPLLARAVTGLFGLSLPGLRLLPAVGGALIVLLAAAMARAFGGGRWAQLLAAVAVACSPVFLASNTLFQTVTFDQLWWAVALLLAIRLIATGDARLWLALGAVIGIGLETKYTILLLAAGLALGALLTPLRAQLRTPWPWLGLALALAIALPNLVWQATHQFPTIEFSRNNNAEIQREQTRLAFVLQQLLLAGPISLPLLLAGGWWLWPLRLTPYRALGWAALAVLGALLLVNGKPYYAAPLYPLLFAAGAVAIERLAEGRARWRPRVILGVFALAGLVPLPLLVPLLPVELMARNKLYALNQDLAEMVGWPEALGQIAAVYHNLPSDQRDTTIILTDSYGEAAAVELLGASYGLPRAVSAHNSYYVWSEGRLDADTYIVVGYSTERLLTLFGDVRPAGVLDNALDVENELAGKPIHICRAPIRSLGEQWPALKHFN